MLLNLSLKDLHAYHSYYLKFTSVYNFHKRNSTIINIESQTVKQNAFLSRILLSRTLFFYPSGSKSLQEPANINEPLYQHTSSFQLYREERLTGRDGISVLMIVMGMVVVVMVGWQSKITSHMHDKTTLLFAAVLIIW